MNNDKSNKNTRKFVFNKFKGRCAYCGIKLDIDDFHIDHIVPKLRKNNDDFLNHYNLERGKCRIENYNPSCKSCNASKGSWKLEQWKEEINKKYDRLLRDSSTFRLLIRFKIVKRTKSNISFYFEKFLT